MEGKIRGDMTGEKSDGDEVSITLEDARIKSVLAKVFGERGSKYEARATT